MNHGWLGLLFDGNEELISARQTNLRARCKDTWTWPPKLVHAWVTAENVNELIRSNGFEGEIDLLSIDVDGMDWWIWKALSAISPRVIEVEIQDCWEPEVAVTVPYQQFVANMESAYFGASLGAFVELAKRRGYRLVGCQRYGFNAFFLRNDVGSKVLPEVKPADCLQHAKHKWSVTNKQPRVKNMKWIDVKDVL